MMKLRPRTRCPNHEQGPPPPVPEYSTALQSPAFAQNRCMAPADLVTSAVTAQEPASDPTMRWVIS